MTGSYHARQGAGQPLPVVAGGLSAGGLWPRRPVLWMAALVLYGLATYVPYLGAWPLTSHEALLAQRASEMTTVGGWVVPHLRGQPDFRKPPLPFWLSAGLAALGGEMNEWAVRLPSVMATLGTTLLLVFWMRRLTTWRTGLVTGLVFLTSGAALFWGRRAEADLQLCFWTTAAVTAFWFGMHESVRRRQVGFFAAMWLSLAAGMLTKGPLPLALLAVAIGITMAAVPEMRKVRLILPLAGPLILAGALAPWVLTVLLRHPDAIRTWYDESLGRYAGQLGHDKPFYFYFLETPLLWLPWVAPVAMGLFLAVRRAMLPRAAWVLMLAWGVGGIVLLSLGAGKRLHYALAVAPPMLVFAGLGVDALVGGWRPRNKAWRWALGLHVLLPPAALVAGVAAGTWLPEFRLPLIGLGVGAAGVLVVVFVLYVHGRPGWALAVWAIGLSAFVTTANGHVIGPMLRWRTTEAAIGRFLAREVPDGVVCYGTVDVRVLFYAGRSLPVVDDAVELTDWIARHPGGYVVVCNRRWRDGLERTGSWQEVLPGSEAWRLASRECALLRVAAAADLGAGQSALWGPNKGANHD